VLVITQATCAKVLAAVKLWSGGPAGGALLVKMNDAVAAITAKINNALPSVWLTLQAKLEYFLVAVLKKLTRASRVSGRRRATPTAACRRR